MKLLFVSLVASLCVAGSLGKEYQCISSFADVPKSWIDMVEPCVEKLESQVKMEIGAAMTYLSMGAHFASDTVNRPGFSKFFFEAASEEREHAIKIIEYLLMRGGLTGGIGKLLKHPMKPICDEEWTSGLVALQEALKLEANVTRSLRNIIIECENPTKSTESKNQKKLMNDYHLVDYLSGDFLDEQYKGQRDIAGKISTLGKMMKSHEKLGEFLFDKKLLNGEV
ncbi:ferritin 1 heavy chain [Andrena cerasifolii]|uniref:ferritin 1 heavy chain n=1 Tax=Andrena cerasifolii TaxID=2819439 RepID=UPI0040383A07